jgi:RNA polymerase sigma factor (sigma-70 family)
MLAAMRRRFVGDANLARLQCLRCRWLLRLQLALAHGHAPTSEELIKMEKTSFGNNRFIRAIIFQKVKRLIQASLVSMHDREDLAQELYARCLESLKHYDPAKGHLYPFIVVAVDRHALNIVRKRFSQRYSTQTESLSKLVLSEGLPSELVELLGDDAHDRRLGRERPKSTEELSDLKMDMEDFISSLPPQLAQLLKRLEHETISDIARNENVPRSAIYWRLTKLVRLFQSAGMKIYLEK